MMAANKPRGLQAARKLRTDRRLNRWVRLAYLQLFSPLSDGFFGLLVLGDFDGVIWGGLG